MVLIVLQGHCSETRTVVATAPLKFACRTGVTEPESS